MESYLEIAKLPTLRASEFVPHSSEIKTVAAFEKIGCKFKIDEDNRIVSLASGVKQFADHCIEQLVHLPNLRELCIVSARHTDGISENGIRRLFVISNLLSFRLMGVASIDGAALRSCFESHSLVFLEASGCAISKLGCAPSNHSQLHFLRLAYCDLGGSSIEFLSKLKSLKRLDLLRTNVSLAEKNHLALLLPDCTIVYEPKQSGLTP